jgi:protocatechuate 3,4-dioxygenase beta subunit
MIDDDDRQVGRILSRREALTLFAAGAVILPAACRSSSSSSDTAAQSGTSTSAGATTPTTTATPTTLAAAPATTVSPPMCVVKPELTEGPYFVDVQLNRSDIRTDPSDGTARPGAPLKLNFRVSRVATGSCAALAGAIVDVWHCDAEGSYSERGETYLRGLQITDSHGVAEFTTIYPGWYPGRTVHIHVKVHLDKRTVLTTQMYFDDTVSARVYLEDPYPGESNRDGFNSTDGLYRRDLELTLSRQGRGYRGLMTLDVARA